MFICTFPCDGGPSFAAVIQQVIVELMDFLYMALHGNAGILD